MTNFKEPKESGEELLGREIEAVFASSPEAAEYQEFLEIFEHEEPLTDEDLQAIDKQIIAAQGPVIRFVVDSLEDTTMKKMLEKISDPQNPESCSDAAGKLVTAYRMTYPGLPLSALVLRDIAMLDMIEEITIHTRPTEETAPHLDKGELQSKIIINPNLDAAYKQALLAATEALVPGEGLDFSDPAATFAAIEKEEKQARASERMQKFRRLFNQLGKEYGVEHDPEFSILTLVTSLAISDEREEPYIPEGEEVSEKLRLLNIPYGVYVAYIHRVLNDIQ